MPDPIVYRVTFIGPDLPPEIIDGVAGSVKWERSEGGVGPWRHRVIVHGATPADAIQVARRALSGLGDFRGFAAEPVRDADGNIRRGHFYSCWDEIDWQATPQRAALSELQREVLGALCNAAEPTALVVRRVGASTATVQAGLGELCEKGLVAGHTEPFWDGEQGDDHADWWKLTDPAWDILGLIKSPRYW